MTQADRVLSTPPTNTPTLGDTFQQVVKMERPLQVIRNFMDAILILSETIEEPHASAINQCGWSIMEEVRELDAQFETLFQLTHPNRENFIREGRWPAAEAL